MFVIENLTKQYRAGRPIFQNLHFQFEPAQGVGIIGPNGSGKTTFLRLLSITSFPTAGKISWNGSDIHKNPRTYLNNVGLVHDEEGLPGHLSDRKSEEHTSELQSRGHLVCRLLLVQHKYQ